MSILDNLITKESKAVNLVMSLLYDSAEIMDKAIKDLANQNKDKNSNKDNRYSLYIFNRTAIKSLTPYYIHQAQSVSSQATLLAILYY